MLAGAAAEFERDLPFGVWVDALDAYVASQEREPLTAVLGSTGSGDERHRVHRALRALLEEIAERKPLVLVLDDLHWSDAASIEVLAALLRRGTTARVLLALGFRSGKAPAKLIAALAGATIIDLGPLSETECARLVGAGLDAEAIYAQSGGNPFYTLQLAQATALPSRSSTGDRLARDAGVPRVVAATIVEQLESLSADARSLVNAGAIAGDPFEPELAYAIAELSPDVGVVALDELLDARLLQPTEVPRRFAFRHPLVRRAVYETTKGGWRLAGHARAAQTLAAQGVTAAARAHHVEQSGVRGDRAAIDVLLEAGDAIAATAPAGAAHWYAAALRLLGDDDRPGRLSALVDLARMQQSTGDLARCATTLLEALELADDTALRLRLTSACASCENFLGRHDAAQRRLVAALEALPDQHSHEAVAILMQLATGAFFIAGHRSDVRAGPTRAGRRPGAGRAHADRKCGRLAGALLRLGRVGRRSPLERPRRRRLPGSPLRRCAGALARRRQPPGLGRVPDRALRRLDPARRSRCRRRSRHRPGPVRPADPERAGDEPDGPRRSGRGHRGAGGSDGGGDGRGERLPDERGAHRDRARRCRDR